MWSWTGCKMGMGGAAFLEVREGWLWGPLVWQVLGTVQNGGVGERGAHGGPGGVCGRSRSWGMSFGLRARPMCEMFQAWGVSLPMARGETG